MLESAKVQAIFLFEKKKYHDQAKSAVWKYIGKNVF